MQPMIGVTAPLRDGKIIVSQDVMQAVLAGGGIPVVLPYTKNHDSIREMIERIDGLLLSGGVDIDPTLFGEEPLPGLGEIMPQRDELETQLIREALGQDLPILAICRGVQMLNVVAGGNMYQDVSSQKANILQHSQKAPTDHLSHFVNIEKGSKLQQIIGQERIKVNSFHHQAVKDPAPGFQVTAAASDGVVEAIESLQHTFVVGVQWHPECSVSSDEPSQKIFRAFIAACRVTATV